MTEVQVPSHNFCLHTHLIKNVPTPDSSQHRTAAGLQTSQHALLAAPLLLGVRELRGAGQSPSALLLQGL